MHRPFENTSYHTRSSCAPTVLLSPIGFLTQGSPDGVYPSINRQFDLTSERPDSSNFEKERCASVNPSIYKQPYRSIAQTMSLNSSKNAAASTAQTAVSPSLSAFQRTSNSGIELSTQDLDDDLGIMSLPGKVNASEHQET